MHLGQKKKSLKNLGTVMQARLKQVSRLGCNRISKPKIIQIITMSLKNIQDISLALALETSCLLPVLFKAKEWLLVFIYQILDSTDFSNSRLDTF